MPARGSEFLEFINLYSATSHTLIIPLKFGSGDRMFGIKASLFEKKILNGHIGKPNIPGTPLRCTKKK